MNIPLVTIIIPAYNYAHFITETLNSVLEQTSTVWECIIIDDGSTDNTTAVVQQFLDINPNAPFRYKRIANGGIGAARMEGVRLSKGKYLQFIDADDLLSPAKLEVQIRHLEESDIALVFSSSRFFKSVDGVQVFQKKYPAGYLTGENLKGSNLIRKLIENNVFTVCSPLIRKELFEEVGGFEKSILYNEDWMLWFKMALHQPFIEFDDDPSSYVSIRLHGSSAMTKHNLMFESELQVREKMECLLNNSTLVGKDKLIKRNRDLLALHHVRSVQISTGMSHILNSFIKNPFSNLQLLTLGGYKLMIRGYKYLIS